jgi:hypothetical protein
MNIIYNTGLSLILWMDYLRRYIDIDDSILYYTDLMGCYILYYTIFDDYLKRYIDILMIILSINDDDNNDDDNDEELLLIDIEKKVE